LLVGSEITWPKLHEAAQKESVDANSGNGGSTRIWRGEEIDCGGLPGGLFAADFGSRLPEVDAVVGTGSRTGIEAVKAIWRAARAAPAFLYHDLTPPLITTPRHASYIKIAGVRSSPARFVYSAASAAKFPEPALRISDARGGKPGGGWGARITLIGRTYFVGEDLGLRDG